MQRIAHSVPITNSKQRSYTQVGRRAQRVQGFRRKERTASHRRPKFLGCSWRSCTGYHPLHAFAPSSPPRRGDRDGDRDRERERERERDGDWEGDRRRSDSLASAPSARSLPFSGARSRSRSSERSAPPEPVRLENRKRKEGSASGLISRCGEAAFPGSGEQRTRGSRGHGGRTRRTGSTARPRSGATADRCSHGSRGSHAGSLRPE